MFAHSHQMSISIQPLCDICHQRPRTHHICEGNTGESTNFCDACFDAAAPLTVRTLLAASRDAYCNFCNAQPCSGGTDLLALATGVMQTKQMCPRCSVEYNSYIQDQLRDADATLSQTEQIAALRTLNVAADTHMKQWLRANESGKDI